jgi:phosphoglycolate phosphatase
MMTDGILFDLDGTLWDSVDEVVLTWNRTLVKHPGLRPPITRQDQEALMGLQMDEIARRLFPNETPMRQAALMAECVQEENQYLAQHGAALYPSVPETLAQLSKTYPLFIVSNCQQDYIEAFLQAHGLAALFTGHLCYGDTGHSKGENIQTVVAQYHLKHPVYLGDTQGDKDAAAFAGVPFIYAAYGFGKLNHPVSIQKFSDLTSLL